MRYLRQRRCFLTHSIFYLDDDNVQLSIFHAMFQHRYDVRTSNSWKEALLMLRECEADIIISDQKMPGIDGTAFLREAARICPHSYRMLLTGDSSMMDVVTEITTGIVQQFMAKPWTEEKMVKALERAAAATDSNH